MKTILITMIATATFSAFAQETKPTAVEPLTQEQKQTHADVAKKQKVLKKKLAEGAPAHDLSKAKADVQKERTKANAADANADAASQD